MRKVLIARELVKSPQLVILDEPFDGLDVNSRARLSRIIGQLMKKNTQVILVTHHLAEILPGISHVLGIKNGQVVIQGKREEILVPEQLEQLYTPVQPDFETLPLKLAGKASHKSSHHKILVAMKNVTVTYGKVLALKNLNWSMKTGENWLIIGPNGSGKTTLLSLIAGDNSQAYSNEIYLFGRPRGSGRSIWDLKRHIGLISSEFQIRYRKPITAFEVVLSGFFDSVGLYQYSTLAQQEITKKWMKMFKIENKSDRRFNRLSYGEQRRVLLARSMVKTPLILMLDEPCQGLDRPARRVMIDLIDFIGRHTTTNILYVTHHLKELPSCITHILQFKLTITGNYTAFSESID
jgi:molybdate transport system ATP-binding protein